MTSNLSFFTNKNVENIEVLLIKKQFKYELKSLKRGAFFTVCPRAYKLIQESFGI